MTDQLEHILEPERWVDRYGDYLYNYCLARVSDAEKAADLVQDTFMAGLKARDSFQGMSTEKTWLTSILKRKIIDSYRKHYSSKEVNLHPDEGMYDGDFFRGEEPFKGKWQEGRGPHSHSLLPEDRMEENELTEIIRWCIDHLPPKFAAVFIMKLVDEAESEEICKELGITSSNLWVLLHRARLKMRACVESKWEV